MISAGLFPKKFLTFSFRLRNRGEIIISKCEKVKGVNFRFVSKFFENSDIGLRRLSADISIASENLVVTKSEST